MNQTITAGPVPANSPVYADRPFEASLRGHAFRRDWVLLLGPRQHGKTSALKRLCGDLSEAGFHVAFVDLQNLPKTDGYTDLLRVFAGAIARTFGTGIAEPPEGLQGDLVSWLQAALPVDDAPVAIVIDEASAISSEELRHSFFGQMRALKNVADGAAAGSVERRVQFIFAGTFRPNKLVANALNSPFNVSEEVYTDDLLIGDVLTLSRLIDPDADEQLATRIFEAVGGQPYLIQKLIQSWENVAADQRLEALNIEIDRLGAEGNHHTDSLFGLALAEKALADVVTAVAVAGSCPNQPTEEFRFLRTMGLMRREGDQLTFRNELYRRLAQASAQVIPEGDNPSGGQERPARRSHFYRLDRSAFNFVTDVRLQEIASSFHNSAVDAVNAGGFRVAMVAFGVCLEAILIDWLLKKTGPERSAAIADSRAAQIPVNFRQPFEVEADPMTWSLVNLMKVARRLNATRGPLEVSDALRNMRNYVHPGKICEVYLAEADMQPEAVSAGSLVAALMRDLQP